MRCPMCRFDFDPEAESSLCSSCPLYHIASGCCLELIPCPNCGYHGLPGEQQPTRELVCAVAVPPALTTVAEFGEDAVPLSELQVGDAGRVVGFAPLDGVDLKRLVAFGLAPGVRFELRQRVPAYIVKIYETELALETDLARAIQVAREHAVEAA